MIMRKAFNKILLCAFILILGAGPALSADEIIFQQPKDLPYKQFLEMRDDPDVVVLDAAQLEKYFMVVPEPLAKEKLGISQKQLDSLLASLIPTKDTKVILYCYNTYMPTRSMPASTSVSMSLMVNGYKNVQELERLWGRESFLEIFGYETPEDPAKLQTLAEKEIIPYAKKIPENYPLENKSE